MIINHNMASLNTYRQLSANNAATSKSLEKLSSGLKINRAGDNAAGLAISEKMRAQIRGLDQASTNAQDAISLIQTAEGSLNETHSILQRMKELATQAANDTNTTSDRGEIQKEINQLTSEINRIGNTTEFNTQKLLNGGTAQTSNIRYRILTQGDPATGSATGAVSAINHATTSVKAGTGAVANFATIQSSVKAASAGSIGSPVLVDTHSSTGGTAAMSTVTEIVKGGLAVVAHTQDTAGAAGTAGVDSYDLTTDFSAGNTIAIGGQTFTAVESSKATLGANEFRVGSNLAGTMENLAAAISGSALGGTYTVTDDNVSKITLTSIATTPGTNAGASTVAAGTSNSRYGFEITNNFKAGDTLTIGDVTYTAGDGTGGTFEIGADIATTVGNIKTFIEAANDANDTDYTISLTDPTWTGSNDNNILVFTAKAAGVDANAADMNASHVDKAAATPGVYKFEVKTQFEAGQTLTIGDVTLTAGDANSATTFKIGADIDETASNIHAALTTAIAGGKLAAYNLSAKGAGIDADTIVLTEKVASGVDLTDPSVTNVTAKAGKVSFEVSTNFSAGDKITIDGQEFTAGDANTATTFKIGATAKDTTTNLKAAIEANATLNGRYTASTGDSTFVTGNKLILEEKAGQIDGVTMAAPTVVKATAVPGVDEFLVTTNFAAGDRLAVGGVGLVAGTDFKVGADVSETATNIAGAINSNATLKGLYTAAVSGDKVTLTEKTASGANLTQPTVAVNAVAGKYEFNINALAAGSTVTIDGTAVTFATGGTETETAQELKGLVENNTTLNAKYSVAVSGPAVTLTQKAGSESTAAPTLSFQTTDGSGFRTQMQIGANTGQSMTVNINDMRASALGVSTAKATAQTVEVDGKQYQVAWTASASVTNGTDDINVEYSLDVTSHDNATAAIKVLDTAINTVSTERSKLGAFQNRLEHTITNLGTSSENLTAAESRVRDVDMAKEMMNFQKNNILNQAATAMLAQANQLPQGVLQLLK